MLVELGLVEQRHKAVLEVLEGGLSVVEVARRFGVVRQTVHEWLRDYARDGIRGAGRRVVEAGDVSASDPLVTF